MANTKSKLTKIAETLIEWVLVFVAIFIMGFVLVYQGLIWGYKKVGGNVKR